MLLGLLSPRVFHQMYPTCSVVVVVVVVAAAAVVVFVVVLLPLQHRHCHLPSLVHPLAGILQGQQPVMLSWLPW